MENILSNFLCGFRKGFNAQQCLIGMIKKAKRIMNKGGHFSALLTGLSKAFDCLPHELLIAKLDACGLKNNALYLIFNYLNNRKQRIKINSSFSSFQNIISRVSQGSLLGPLLFNIFLTDIYGALRDLAPFQQFKKREEQPCSSVNFRKVSCFKPATLLKLTLLHG